MTGWRQGPGRVAIQQRVLPAYRAPFLDALAARCLGGLSVFAGSPRPDEAIRMADGLKSATWHRADNIHLFGGPAYLCRQPGLLTWLEATDPDALVIEANWRYLSNGKAIAWMKDRSRPVLGWGLGAPPGLGALLRGRMLRHLDSVIAYSTRGAAQYAQAGVPVDRIYVAPNAVERPPATPPKRPPVLGRPVRLIFVGRLQPRKRVDELLQACAAATPRPELWIVGDGPDRDRLTSIAGRIFPQTVFTGALHGADLRARLDRADLFVLPGTGGLALQQAMARGLPVIAARGDGSQEDMVTPDNGWLVPPGGPGALGPILKEALADPARLWRMGLASYDLARRRFHPDVMVEVFDRALRDVGSR